MVRSEVGDDDEGHARVVRQTVEQRLQRFDPAGRRTDTDDQFEGLVAHATAPHVSRCRIDLGFGASMVFPLAYVTGSEGRLTRLRHFQPVPGP